MKIIEIEVFLFRYPISESFPHPYASFVRDGSIFLKIITDQGVSGLGEPSPYGGDLYEVQKIIKKVIEPKLIGKNPLDLKSFNLENDFSEGIGYGHVAHNCAQAGISQAVWDIIGKVKGLPVCQLLSKDGKCKNRIKAYASGGMIYENEDPMLLVEEVLRCKDEGYTAWKMRPAMPTGASHLERNQSPPKVDIERLIDILTKIRLAVGNDMDLMIDAGCRFQDIDEAIKIGEVLVELDFTFFEEPIPRVVKDYVTLNSKLKIPISGGESLVSYKQFKPWVTSGAYDIVQPDVNLVGITEAMRVASKSDEYGKQCIVHNWANDVSIAANVHVAAAIPSSTIAEYNITYNPLRTKLVTDPFVPVNGYFHLPATLYQMQQHHIYTVFSIDYIQKTIMLI